MKLSRCLWLCEFFATNLTWRKNVCSHKALKSSACLLYTQSVDKRLINLCDAITHKQLIHLSTLRQKLTISKKPHEV